MGDPPRSPSTDPYSILGISKDICKAYKSLFMKWHPDLKSPTSKIQAEAKSPSTNNNEDYKVFNGKYEEERTTSNDAATPATGFSHYQNDEDGFFTRRSSFFSRSASRRSKTPTPRSFTNTNPSSRSTTPLSRSMSRRSNSETELPIPTTPLSRNMSRKGSSETIFRSKSRRRNSETEASLLRNCTSSLETEKPASSLSRNMSKRSTTTPIIFSRSTALTKPPPVEKKLKCTLEELLEGCVKMINITRDVITNTGIIVQEEETLKIQVKPGWKKGTKVTFEGKGDEKPGYLPADIIFSIDEQIHPLFTREGDNLEIGLEVPLLKALTGCSVSIPLLGGEKMTLSFDDIIYPGYEKIIRGQGMPNPKDPGRRGDLRINFIVEFPTELSDEKRAHAVRLLQDCT
ncbi:dnaj like subfamily b member 13 [Fagus crenata]